MPLDPLTIISAVVAVLVLWKLKSVLGQRTGLERPPSDPFAGSKAAPRGAIRGPQAADPAARAPARQPAADGARWAPYAETGSPVAAGLDAIAAVEPGFAPGPFLDGAKIAYEHIVTAFAAGDRDALRNLLAPDVYESFAAALSARQGRGETLTTTFVSLDDAKLVSAARDGKTARLGVRFASKQISATHDASGQLTDGSPDQVVDMDDIWTFVREMPSRDPNWKLVATQTGH